VWSVVQIIAGVALMMQSYLVTEDDNKRLNSDQKVFKWLVAVLACAIKGKRWRGYGFAVIEVIEVADVLTFILIIIIRGKSGPPALGGTEYRLMPSACRLIVRAKL